MFKKMMAGVLLAALAITAIAPAAVSAKGSDLNIVDKVVKVNERTGMFDTLVAAVVCTPGIAEALSNEEAELTVFGPTDYAFWKAGFSSNPHSPRYICDDHVIDDATRALVLQYHVFGGGEVKYREALKLATRKGFPITMLAGGDVELVRKGWFRLFVDGASSAPSRVILPNVDASNGVIHVINRVLLP